MSTPKTEIKKRAANPSVTLFRLLSDKIVICAWRILGVRISDAIRRIVRLIGAKRLSDIIVYSIAAIGIALYGLLILNYPIMGCVVCILVVCWVYIEELSKYY